MTYRLLEVSDGRLAACMGKVPHRTREAASKHAQRMRRGRTRKVVLRVYRCECGYWHVGSDYMGRKRGG